MDCIPHDTPWHLTTHTRHSSNLFTCTIKHTHIHTPPVIVWPCQENTDLFTWKMTREYPAISFCDLLQTLLSLPSSHSSHPLICSSVCVCVCVCPDSLQDKPSYHLHIHSKTLLLLILLLFIIHLHCIVFLLLLTINVPVHCSSDSPLIIISKPCCDRTFISISVVIIKDF